MRKSLHRSTAKPLGKSDALCSYNRLVSVNFVEFIKFNPATRIQYQTVANAHSISIPIMAVLISCTSLKNAWSCVTTRFMIPVDAAQTVIVAPYNSQKPCATTARFPLTPGRPRAYAQHDFVIHHIRNVAFGL